MARYKQVKYEQTPPWVHRTAIFVAGMMYVATFFLLWVFCYWVYMRLFA